MFLRYFDTLGYYYATCIIILGWFMYGSYEPLSSQIISQSSIQSYCSKVINNLAWNHNPLNQSHKNLNNTQ